MFFDNTSPATRRIYFCITFEIRFFMVVTRRIYITVFDTRPPDYFYANKLISYIVQTVCAYMSYVMLYTACGVTRRDQFKCAISFSL